MCTLENLYITQSSIDMGYFNIYTQLLQPIALTGFFSTMQINGILCICGELPLFSASPL